MKRDFTFKAIGMGKAYKKVFYGLDDMLDDNTTYKLTFDGTLLDYVRILWHLRFPGRKPIFTWIREGLSH